MSKTNIEWTDVTWNPTRGCSRISPGCGGGTPGTNKGGCYAERQAIRHAGPGGSYEGLAKSTGDGPRWTGTVRMLVDQLVVPLSWRAPRMCFVDSMSDLFHEQVTNEFIAAAFGVMLASSTTTFQVLTKRAERMREWFSWLAKEAQLRDEQASVVCLEHVRRVAGDEAFEVAWALAARRGTIMSWPASNVWMGVSVEDVKHGVPRISHLRHVPAAVRFLSLEPLLERVSVSPVGLHWLIVGGESGPGARPFHLEWAEHVVDQGRLHGLPVHVKQIGSNPWLDGRPYQMCPVGMLPHFCRDTKGGDMSEWPEKLRVRQWPSVEAKGEVTHAS